ncbi:flagellar hook-basal body complex protein FliE [Shumkonia mesophila]|uniref:flagellar hook-basal body complex protein FliE n=1 Tax=Shumkonia mesophila TaxID=2838854 RepID=UPI002934AB50|nr:flagellar hook-basal body complex protein FliE [Shumkonia mesophila]
MVTSIAGINSAAAAYATAAKRVGSGLEARDVAGKAGGGDFAELVKSALDEARLIGQRSEKLSMEGIRDNADLNQVITAVAEAEVTLQTVVSIRDKVIDAYKEILRMPI